VKLHVDPNLCEGHGRCYEIAPDLFEDDERGHCILKTKTVPPNQQEAAQKAAQNCPEKAITTET
jgi:ferredoxin